MKPSTHPFAFNSTTARVGHPLFRLVFSLLILPPSVVAGGAYLSVFRAQWSTSPSLPLHAVVPNMERGIDVYAPYPSLKYQPRVPAAVKLEAEVVKAVPAVVAVHPTREARFAGGDAFGKISLFTPL